MDLGRGRGFSSVGFGAGLQGVPDGAYKLAPKPAPTNPNPFVIPIILFVITHSIFSFDRMGQSYTVSLRQKNDFAAVPIISPRSQSQKATGRMPASPEHARC